MRFGIKNLGPIQNANIEIGDLTIVCGKNNTGKTYLTYSLFSFLETIRSNVKIDIPKVSLDIFTSKGEISLDLVAFLPNFQDALEKAMKSFSEVLFLFLARNPNYTKNVNCSCSIDRKEHISHLEKLTYYNDTLPITKSCDIIANKKANNTQVTFMLSNRSDTIPEKSVINNSLCLYVSKILNTIFSDIFVITCERTGASLFRNALIMSKEMNKEIAQNSTAILEKLRKDQDFYGYAFPIVKDIMFATRYYEESLVDSFLCHGKQGKMVFECFSKIVDGSISVKENNNVTFTPNDSNIPLHLVESSSSIRALSELFFYLKSKAKKGQILMIDEPELSLHPENQRLIARLFALLVNAGIKVFITTHSDYIIREFNSLIMLNQDNEAINRIRRKYKYKQGELLNPEQIRCYVIKNNSVSAMDVSSKYGIKVTSFDDTILKVNEIQHSLLFGV